MLVIDESMVNSLVNTLFPINSPKILGANFDLILPFYNYNNLRKVRYVNNSKNNSSFITMPGDLTDFSQIVLLVGSTGNRATINSSGFSYFIYSPHICIPNKKVDETEDRYIECICVPYTDYTKVNIPGFPSSGTVGSNEDKNRPLINPKTFLTTQKCYYVASGTGELLKYNYGLLPGEYGSVMIWYLPYDLTNKEGTT